MIYLLLLFSFLTHCAIAADGGWPNLCAFGNLLRNYTHVSTVKKNLLHREGCNSIILYITMYNAFKVKWQNKSVTNS